MPKADPAPYKETWRKWTEEDRKKQPKRLCSIAGCKGAPVQVKETELEDKTRKHVYCALHLPD